MELCFNTKLKGCIILTRDFHTNISLLRDKSLYKFIWVQNGTLTLEIDHVEMVLEKDEIITLTPLHHIKIKKVSGEYLTLLFNSNFYCIYGHDSEVSCNGFLFNGTSNILRLRLSEAESFLLHEISSKLIGEYRVKDNLQEEMLRILLKRFIITCTRIARDRFEITPEKEKSFDIVRQYFVLVDNNFREKKMVQEYAGLLCRSPKTLSNLFSSYGLPSPLRVIHERLLTEAKRLLLYSTKKAKEIAAILGFEDLSAFSRFFKKMTGETISGYRKKEKRE
ncbi:MAG: helix-turn-helix domain-containing protein [Bacteroidales bacterium]|nr:helix-turn-helix domain-containing protein [Bacteroidales bacterium]